MCRQMHKPSHISMAQGRISFCNAAKFWYLNGSWFLIFLELCLSGAGMSSSAWNPSSMESGLVYPFFPGPTSLHCFDSELGMPSSQLSAGQLTSNASSACGTGVGSLIPSPSIAFSHSSCSRLWLMGNGKFQCRVQLYPSPSMGYTTYTGKFG